MYHEDPDLLREHANQEETYRVGGYARRQLMELLQNASDALARGSVAGRVEIRLAGNALYVANEGAPFDIGGVKAICHAFLSDKRGTEIGRFGLGFKSVLGITKQPEVFSSSVSFGFGLPEDISTLQGLVSDESSVPLLRLPSVLDVEAAEASDDNLRDLLSWATTVVRLPLYAQGDRLYEELGQFNPQFLLFSTAVAELTITIEGAKDTRKLDFRRSLARNGVTVLDAPDGARQEWIVCEAIHRPSDQARDQAGSIVGRKEITVSCAVPIDVSNLGRSTLGQFWAFFPLEDRTTATAIFNAPWSVNDDRTLLQPGLFNLEIYGTAARLFLDAIARIPTAGDPARVLDYLPSRVRETHGRADRWLSENIPELARTRPLVPDSSSTLRRAERVKIPRLDYEIDRRAVQLYFESGLSPVEIVHPSVFNTRQRLTRLRDLVRRQADRPGQGEISLAEWLNLLVRDRTTASMRAAVSVAGALSTDALRSAVGRARILLDSSGEAIRLEDHTTVALPAESASSSRLRTVASELADDPSTRKVLVRYGFREVSPRMEIEALLSGGVESWSSHEWSEFWETAGLVSPGDAIGLIREYARRVPFKVRASSGAWVQPKSVLLGGNDFSVDDSHRLDTAFHAETLSLMGAAGVVTTVRAIEAVDYTTGLAKTYLDFFKREISRQLDGSDVDVECVDPAVGPVEPLLWMAQDEDAIARWSDQLMAVRAPRHSRLIAYVRGGQRHEADVDALQVWAVRQYGRLLTTWGPRRPSEALAPELGKWRRLLPVSSAEWSATVGAYRDFTDIPEGMLLEALQRCPSDADPTILGEFVTLAIDRIPAANRPEMLPAYSGNQIIQAQREAVIIASTPDELSKVNGSNVPWLYVRPDAAKTLAAQTGGHLVADAWSTTFDVTLADDPGPLLDRFPELRKIANPQLDGALLAPCMRILRSQSGPGGVTEDEVSVARDGDRLFVSSSLDDDELLHAISDEYALHLTSDDIRRLLANRIAVEVARREEQCRNEPDPARKLAILFDFDEVKAALPSGLLEMIGDDPDFDETHEIGQLAIDVHGYDVLSKLKSAFARRGHNPPNEWAGGIDTVRFVKRLGFDTAFAGESNAPLDPYLLVLGRPGLGELHNFQKQLAGKIRELLLDVEGNPHKRALLYLPTGAGKTRVTVEAIVRMLLTNEMGGPILWIAQSEELCEQAVQTWSDVWREFAGNIALHIGRLWSRNEVDESREIQVIVATDAKLRVLHWENYEWLRSAGAVIIDEAHRSGDSAMYDEILANLGIDDDRTDRPLLGLTATPYKGRSERATQALVDTFGQRRLNVLGDDPYAVLQDRGVLSRVRHDILKGVDVQLQPGELLGLKRTDLIPPEVLNRVGKDRGRMERLLRHIVSLPEDWPTLVFTPTVASAYLLATLLKRAGRSSRAVDGSTRPPERRRIIEDFRSGRFQVLVNCNLLTQGFDAPAVRALYVAKPTFSPNSYIQMVGRGLRGPENGGNGECYVVNVEDTFAQFGRQLAFREFDYLWTDAQP